MEAEVGIIANPASGKDIRRLVAYGSVVDNEGKVALVRRMLLGLKALGVTRVAYLPDYYGIVRRAFEGLNREDRRDLEVRPLPLSITGEAEDSVRGAALLRDLGVRVIAVIGGDGTNRVVAKGCGEVPLLPVSTGTNNVFPYYVESTLAGLVAGLAARGLLGPDSFFRAKKIVVTREKGPPEIALIDAALVRGFFVGARAVWEPGDIEQLLLTQAEPGKLGLSSIGSFLAPLGRQDAGGLFLELGGDEKAVLAPIAPGAIRRVPVKSWRRVAFGEKVRFGPGPRVVALDGEREIELRPGEFAELEVVPEGPVVIDFEQALREAASRKILFG